MDDLNQQNMFPYGIEAEDEEIKNEADLEDMNSDEKQQFLDNLDIDLNGKSGKFRNFLK